MRLFIASFLLFLTSIVSGQLNDAHIYVDVQNNILEEVNITSLFKPVPVSHNYNLTDSLGFDPVPSGSGTNVYGLDFQSIQGYKGDITTIIEYTEPSLIPGIPQTNYTTIHFRVKDSKVISHNDYTLSQGSAQTIYPLTNDNSSHGSLSIVKLGHVSGGTASISASDAITIDLSDESGQVLYFAEDSIGNISSAMIHIVEEDDSKVKSSELFVDNSDQIEIILSSGSYFINTNPSHGTLIASSDSHVWYYQPNTGYSGSDNFSFSSTNGGDLDYQVTILANSSTNSFLVDDEVYIPTNGSLTFDVLANDYRSNFSVYSHSPELTQLSNGVFEYTPASGLTGDLNFEYKIFTGLQLFTAQITVHVSDFAPTSYENYNFDLIQDQPLRIIHNTPSGAYTFDLDIEPTNGSVVILDEFDQEITACDTLTGANTIIYYPDNGYTGPEEFDLIYETTTGISEIVKVDVNVLNSNNTACLCLEDCVFEGDHNDDGRVDIKDILDLGLNVGEGGVHRTQDFDEAWTGQFSGNWGYQQMNSEIDLKCGDSDGDGYIDTDDIDIIEENYGKLSRFQTQVSSALSDVPVYFVPQSTAVDSGDLLVIDIFVGDSAYPAIDMNGLAFSFLINPDLIDSSSVNFYLYDDNWLGYNSPIKDFSYVPQDGQVDIAITRFGQGSTDGFGIVGALEFIVEDEVNGFRRSSNSYVESLVQMTGILSVNEFGEYSSHPPVEQVIQSKAENDNANKESLTAEAVTVFPNPSADIVNLYSDSKNIDKVEIIDALGRIVNKLNFAADHSQTISLANYNDGLYFLRIHSGEQSITKKVHKVGL